MTAKTLTLVWMLAMAALAVGCASPDCKTLCEAGGKCEGATPPDCSYCDKAEKVNDLAACGDQFDSYLTCLDSQEDVCKTGVQCKVKGEQYQDCVAGYCINHAADCQ